MRPLFSPAVWQNVDVDMFNETIRPLAKPAVLKGLVNDWPLVQAAQMSDQSLLKQLASDYKGGNARFLRQSAQEDGYYFYNQEYSGFNFTRNIASLDTIFELMLARAENPDADRIAMQSAPINEHFNNLTEHNQMPLLPNEVEPRFWLGNDSKVNTHCDDADNIACVVSGKRVFTLFAPEQIKNLYVGSLENTPGGAAVSLAKLDEPDFIQFPKLADALKHAFRVELEAGDAIYIPAMWWHHVEAQSDINMLVNYWQGGSIGGFDHPSGLDAVLLGLVSIAKLPEAQKQAWMTIFQYFVGSSRAEFDYVPDPLKGLLTGNCKDSESKVYQWLQTVVEQSNKK